MTTTRRPAAILAADVAGYSLLMGADEEGIHERLKSKMPATECWRNSRASSTRCVVEPNCSGR